MGNSPSVLVVRPEEKFRIAGDDVNKGVAKTKDVGGVVGHIGQVDEGKSYEAKMAEYLRSEVDWDQMQLTDYLIYDLGNCKEQQAEDERKKKAESRGACSPAYSTSSRSTESDIRTFSQKRL